MSEVTVNYTDAMVAKLREAAPINLEKAKKLAAEFGKSYRSVIAKAKSEGIEYNSVPVAASKPREISKAMLVEDIAEMTGIAFYALDKANRLDLINLRKYLVSVAPEEEAPMVADEEEAPAEVAED